MQANTERGIALILALFLTAALSTLGASLMFLAQTETYATMNYRMMSQARYAGEAGINKASDFLHDSTQYTVPAFGSADDLANYDRTKSPVICLAGCPSVGQPVILSATASQASNYPVGAVQTAFNTAAQGTLAAGNTTLTYNSFATLISMQAFDAYGGTQGVVQTWEITGAGGLTGPRSATVEIVALIETPKVPANNYAAFATGGGCGAITFDGNMTVDSYDSTLGPPGTGPGNSTETSGGDVGTNGNLDIGGSVAVQGNLYTPREGVGACTAGAITGLTVSGGSAEVTGSIVPLPKAIVYPPPILSVTPPTTPVTINAGLLGIPATACTTLGLTFGPPPVGNCTVSGTTVIIDGNGFDVTLPSVTIASGFTLRIVGNASPAPQNVNINSLTGTGALEIDANMTGALNESVVLKLAGMNPDGTEMTTPPIDFDSLSWKQNSVTANTNYDASALQIVYGGTAEIVMKGGSSESAATIYAPNASFTLKGTQEWYGSILAKTVRNVGTGGIHYDRRLSTGFWVMGQPMIGTFSWKRF
jgi:Tfp pilus assembly protein PilX